MSDRVVDRLYDVGFLLVEGFAALEVTAVLVANARITESLGLREELSSFILTSYLGPLFAGMLLALAFLALRFDPGPTAPALASATPSLRDRPHQQLEVSRGIPEAEASQLARTPAPRIA